MTYEQINTLTVEDCQELLISRLGIESPTQEQLEAELVLYKQELIEAEDARIAFEALQGRVDELGDVADLINVYFQDNSEDLSPDDNWNPAAFWAENVENSNCGFWRFEVLSKPTLEQLEEIKSNL